MTLGEIEQNVLDRLGGSGGNQDLTRRIRSHINITQREILTKKGIGIKLRRGVVEFSSTAGSTYAVLPQAVSILHGVVDPTNNQPLGEISLGELLEEDPGIVYSGNSRRYALINLSAPLAVEINAACELFMDSDSALDLSGCRGVVEGMTADGQLRRSGIGLSGTTAVSVNTSITNWLKVHKWYLTAPAVGHVTLTEGNGGPELARISPGNTMAKYTKLQMFPKSAAAADFLAVIQYRIMDLTDPFAESIIHEDFHWLLESGALAKEYMKKEKQWLYREEFVRFRDGVAELRSYLNKQTSPTLGDKTGYSQLGVWFENGT